METINPIISVLMYVYPALCVFVPCILYQVVSYRKEDVLDRISKKNLAWRYVFILYVFLVMNVVGVGSIWEIGAYGTVIRLDEIHLIPFQSEGYMTYVLNIIMFTPLGFLLPFVWDRYRRPSATALAGLLFSLSIELGQLFNRRQTDIDDLIMNTLGAVIGFSIWYLWDKLFHTKPKDTDIFADSPLLYLTLSVLGTFLLYNWRWFLEFV